MAGDRPLGGLAPVLGRPRLPKDDDEQSSQVTRIDILPHLSHLATLDGLSGERCHSE
jgi:hypothetical protein